MLELEDVDVYYGPVQALRGITLTVGAGEMVALLGANGAGKTTTLRTISGLLHPRRGSVRLDGADIGALPAQRVVGLGVSHLPQGRELFPELTVTENLRLGHWARRREKAELERRMESVFHLFPRLRERATQRAATMSGGEQQMLAMGRALMTEPRLLLVDELSMGLAPMVVDQLFAALAEVNHEQGTAVIVVEQFVHLALRHTARAYVLAKGEVVVAGASAELLESPEVMAAYLGEAEIETPETSEPTPVPTNNGNGKRRARARTHEQEAVS